MIFDEIDAGIGGQTAHAVADTLVRLSERAQVVTSPTAADREPRGDRHFSVEKVPGDPTHTRIRELGDDERREEIERILGGREFLSTVADGARADKQGRDGATSPAQRTKGRAREAVELTGRARLDQRTKHLVRRLSADDVAIIDHSDIDRVSAEELVESGVGVVVNVSPSSSGKYPTAGPGPPSRRRPARRRAGGAALRAAVRGMDHGPRWLDHSER